MTQLPTTPCLHCGRAVPVTSRTAYEFDWRCPCGCAGTVAWAHAAPPPALTTPKHPPLGVAQGTLFPEATQ